MASWAFSFEQQLPNKLTAVRRNTDGVLVEYKYDERYNIREITENGAVVSSAAYPAACTVSTRKTCNKPLWTRDANGNQTDYGYAADSGHTVLVRLPPDKNGVRPETRYDYQPKYAFYLRSAGAQPQRADTPLHVLVRERKCLTGNMNDGGDCSKGSADAVVTEYDYGPEEQPNNLLLRGMTVTAFADGVRQTRRTCYTNDIYRPQAGLNSCYQTRTGNAHVQQVRHDVRTPVACVRSAVLLVDGTTRPCRARARCLHDGSAL
jgi:hypothetical protein